MTTARRTDDTLSRRMGQPLGVTTRLTVAAMVLALLATTLAASGATDIVGASSSWVIAGLSGFAGVLLMAITLFQVVSVRRLRVRVLDPIDDMNSRLRTMIIAGVNDVRPLDANAVSELRDVWGNYQKLAAAVERARAIAQAAIDANSARSRTAVDAAMEAEHEKEIGETDPLTHLYNRRRLDSDLERDAAAVVSGSGQSFAFVMVDVDHFKSFNDNYGHQKGDEILQGLARILKESVRGLDTAYRYGGEEFSLILRNINPATAYEVVERIRGKVEDIFAATDTPMTASFGVSLSPHCAKQPTDLIAAADAALYESKEGGRNRVSLAPPRSSAPAVPEPEAAPPESALPVAETTVGAAEPARDSPRADSA